MSRSRKHRKHHVAAERARVLAAEAARRKRNADARARRAKKKAEAKKEGA